MKNRSRPVDNMPAGAAVLTTSSIPAGETVFETDEQKIAFIKDNLHVPAVCDILDSIGYREQAMHRRLRPLLPDMHKCGFAGRARTLRWMHTDYVVEEDPYGLEIEAIDSLRSGDVVVHSTDHQQEAAPWGELLTTVAMRNGAVGCVCDGMVRDCIRIIDMGFPVFSAGIRPYDSKGRVRVVAYDVPVRCGDVLVRTNDIVFADFDGIVVIPTEVEGIVFNLALDKIRKENRTRHELIQGRTLREVYDSYGVL